MKTAVLCGPGPSGDVVLGLWDSEFRWTSPGLRGATTAKRRTFTAAFGAGAGEEPPRAARTVRQIAAGHSLHPNQVGQSKPKDSEGLVELFERGRMSARDGLAAEIHKPPEKIGQLALERDS